jgi:hypothetical protein
MTSPASGSTWCGLVLATFAATVLACEAESPTGMIVTVRSDLRVPGELNRIVLRILTGESASQGSPPQTERSCAIGPGAGHHTLPLKVALERVGHADRPITIEARGFQDQVELVARSVRVVFLPGERRQIVLELNRDCIRAQCGPGTTCVSRKGCVAPDLDIDGTGPDPVGPGCDCGSHFPFCVGSRWVYRVCDLVNNNACNPKTWSIVDYGKVPDMQFDKSQRDTFVQIRQSAVDRSRRWLTRTPTLLLWERDEWFDAAWQPTTTRYYVPSKLRMDESPEHTRPGAKWTLNYTEHNARPGMPPDNGVAHVDAWEVISHEELPNFPAEYRAREPLCQRRVDRAGEAVRVANFCFVKGVGKVYELSPNLEEETLIEYDVRGCGKSMRAAVPAAPAVP